MRIDLRTITSPRILVPICRPTRRFGCRAPLAAAALALLGTGLGYAAPGDFDPSFGTNGVVIMPVGGLSGYAYDAAVQDDGKVVACLAVGNDSGLARYLTDGTLDPAFGSGGTVLTSLSPTHDDFCWRLVLQPDGKILTVNDAIFDGISYKWAVVRYLANGTLDPSWGAGGIVATGLSAQSDWVQALTLTPDGHVLVVGYTDAAGSGTIVSYTSDGSLDPTFGSGGISAHGHDYYVGVLRQADGKILVVGTQGSDSLIARLNADGTLDTTFGLSGVRIIDVGPTGAEQAADVVQLPDGKLVVVGSFQDGANNFETYLMRLEADGSLDTSFGSSGIARHAFGTASPFYDYLPRLLLQADGKMVAGGNTGDSPLLFAAGRFLADGSLDATFGSGGMITPLIGSKGYGWTIARQTDGKLIVPGTAYNGTRWDVALIRVFGNTCGNGILEAPEDCDDGNSIDGDCCSSSCTVEAAGTTCTDDGNACTDDTCNGSGACAHPANTAPCDDGVYCNGADTCAAGTCSHGGDPCLGGAECNATCDEAADACAAPAGTTCTDDGNTCTNDTCDGSGACAHPANTAPCDDGVYCNGADTCAAGTCSHGGDPCLGGTECNATCDEAADACAAPAGTTCTDDGNACTNDTCDGSGTCAHPANTAPCDDGVYCNGADTCAAGTCSHGGDPCLGGAECNATCDEAADACAAPAGTTCTDDGNACTNDTCDGSGTCAHPAGHSGVVCRAAATPCDAPEACDGVATDCPADVALPDSDDDGVCDDQDPCTGGTAVTRARFAVKAIDRATTYVYLDGLAKLAVPPALDPITKGLRIRLLDHEGTAVLDTLAPAGTYDASRRVGWRARPGNRFRFVDRSKTGPVRLAIIGPSRLYPRKHRLAVVLRTPLTGAVAAQLTTAEVIVDAPLARTGQCGQWRRHRKTRRH